MSEFRRVVYAGTLSLDYLVHHKRQMGLCYERLGQTKKAIGAFRQAWNTLLEQRDHGFKRDAGNKGKYLGVKKAPRRNDGIGAILRQARAALGIEISDSLGSDEEGESDSGGGPAMTGGPPSNTSEGCSASVEGDDRPASLFDRRGLTLAC